MILMIFCLTGTSKNVNLSHSLKIIVLVSFVILQIPVLEHLEIVHHLVLLNYQIHWSFWPSLCFLIHLSVLIVRIPVLNHLVLLNYQIHWNYCRPLCLSLASFVILQILVQNRFQMLLVN